VLHPSRVHHLWSLAHLTKLSLRYIIYSIQWILVDHVERASAMRPRGKRSDLDVHEQRSNICCLESPSSLVP